MERWKNKVAVVTGASSGIGAACVLQLVRSGMIVVGLARRKEKMYCLKSELPNELRENLHVVKCDITMEHEVRRSFGWVMENLGGTDVLVHSAGIIEHTELLRKGNTRQIRKTVDTNIMGTFFCVKEAVNSMVDRDVEGHIIIINSVAGHVVPNLGPELPSLNMYPATKFALTAMVETYRQELQRKSLKIRISSISPGMVDTEILPQNIKQVVKEFMVMLKSEDVAETVLYALSTPASVQIYDIIVKHVEEKF